MDPLKKAHVAKTIASFVGLPKQQLHLLKDVPEKLELLLMRTEEESAPRDQWGNFEHPYAKNTQEGLLWQPEVDIFAKKERLRLQQLNVPLIPLWPSGHSFALCLTHDVDHLDLSPTYPLLYRKLKHSSNFKETFKSIARFFVKKPKIYQNTKNTLEESLRIEKKLGVTASYFFTLYPLERYSRFDCLYNLKDTVSFEGKRAPLYQILREMNAEGFDVGLHGSYFSAIDEGLLATQKQMLEEHLQNTVETTRQHWLHLKLPDTLQIQAKAGLKADTTLGYNRNIGYRAGTGFPFKIFDDTAKKEIPVLEVPMVLQDGALIGSNALEYAPETMLSIMQQFVDKTESLESCLTLLFHPDIFERPGLSNAYESIIRYAKDKGAFITDLKTLSRYWDKRLKTLGY